MTSDLKLDIAKMNDKITEIKSEMKVEIAINAKEIISDMTNLKLDMTNKIKTSHELYDLYTL